MAIAKGITPPLERNMYWWGDIWKGTAAQLIDAGLIEQRFLPGTAGNNKHTATYVNGQPVRKGQNRSDCDGYLSIKRISKYLFEVWKPIPKSEQPQRETYLTVQEEKEKYGDIPHPKFQIGEFVDVTVLGMCSKPIARITRLRWADEKYLRSINNSSLPGWLYTLEPAPTEKYSLHWEADLSIRPTAELITFPPLLSAPVIQGRPRGARPKKITAMSTFRYIWEGRRKEIAELEGSILTFEGIAADTEKFIAAKREKIAQLRSMRLKKI